MNPEAMTNAGAQRFLASLSITELFAQLHTSEQAGHVRAPRFVLAELARRRVEVVR